MRRPRDLPIEQDGVPIPAQTPSNASNFTNKTESTVHRCWKFHAAGSVNACRIPGCGLHGKAEESGRERLALLRAALPQLPVSLAELAGTKSRIRHVAMVVYSPISNKTCFFQRLAKTQIRDVRQERSSFAAVEALPGKNIASPFSSDADKFWDNPNVVEDINCARCHDANPFVRSPYAHQVTKDPSNKLPGRQFGQAYVIFYLDHFGDKWKQFHGYFNINDRVKGKPGACLVCHSLGAGFSSGLFTEYSAGELAPGQLNSSTFPRTHWMPPGAIKDIGLGLSRLGQTSRRVQQHSQQSGLQLG